jgi:hypothetical protein
MPSDTAELSDLNFNVAPDNAAVTIAIANNITRFSISVFPFL